MKGGRDVLPRAIRLVASRRGTIRRPRRPRRRAHAPEPIRLRRRSSASTTAWRPRRSCGRGARARRHPPGGGAARLPPLVGHRARLVVVGMVSNGFSIVDPADPGMLDVVGFDTATPQLISDFTPRLPVSNRAPRAPFETERSARCISIPCGSRLGRSACRVPPRSCSWRCVARRGSSQHGARGRARPRDQRAALRRPRADVAETGSRTGLRSRRPQAMRVRIPPSALARRRLRRV